MDDLVVFLRARIAEDEQVAREAVAGPREVHSNGEVYSPAFDREVRYSGFGGRLAYSSTEQLFVTADSEGLSASVQETEAAHVARWDPARVLAECDAKRQIVDRCWKYVGPHMFLAAGEVLRLLALHYRDHHDCLPEWTA